MADISALIVDFANALWSMLTESALLLLVGLFLAGMIHLVLSEKNLTTLLKGGRFAVTFKSALVGIPLPLCSCSVLPVAHQLRQSGLSKGGTAAFLVATPETGADSILLTYSLTDPLLTVARPVAAFVTALAAGVAVETSAAGNPTTNPNPVETCHSCHCESDAAAVNSKKSVVARLGEGVRYGFGKLVGDLSPYLISGYLLAGIVAVVLGSDMTSIPDSLKYGWGGYAGAIVIGLPLYICATSSTPLAAVLLASGFSPGAIMVFLLVGPATNMASITVIRKILGGGALLRYLAVLIVVSIICGVAVDSVYSMTGFQPDYTHTGHADHASLVGTIAAIVFSILVLYHGIRKLMARLF